MHNSEFEILMFSSVGLILKEVGSFKYFDKRNKTFLTKGNAIASRV